MVERVRGEGTGKRTGKGGASAPKRKLLARRPPGADDLRAILDACGSLYRAVHVAWARADLRERGVREVKVEFVKPKPAKVEHKRRAVPALLPGDPPPPAAPPWEFCTVR